MRKVAPGFQQTSGSKEAAASLRRGHIQWLNLRYTQVSRQELRCQPQAHPGEGETVCPTPVTLTHLGTGLDAQGLLLQSREIVSIRQTWVGT